MAQRLMREQTAAPHGQAEAETNYHRQWRAYAVRWYTGIFLAVLWLPVTAVTLWYCRTVLHNSLAAAVVVGTWSSLTLATVWWQGQFRCPRCRRRYAALGNKRGGSNYTLGFFDRACTNCYLRKFEKG